MNVDFAPDLDLSKEVEGFIFGVKGIEGSDGIVYAITVVIGVFFYDCYKDKCLLSRSDSCIEQAAIEGE
jgi:hypothetical protein